MKAESTIEVRPLAGAGSPRYLDRPGHGLAAPCHLARLRMQQGWGDPLFLADWKRALFLHFEVDPKELRQAVPFELDLWQGETAFVSLVAFTMRGMRPAFGGGVTRRLSAALATHGFLNARTYVRGRDGEAGIFFLREWLPNRLARCLGPVVYGLPYRLGQLDYRHSHGDGVLAGEVVARSGAGRLAYRAQLQEDDDRPALRDFLLERYTAFTAVGGVRRKFHVWHEAWQAAALEAEISDDSLLDLVPGCGGRGRLVAAHYSSGVSDVWMGRPRLA